MCVRVCAVSRRSRLFTQCTEEAGELLTAAKKSKIIVDGAEKARGTPRKTQK